ncbi:MAG: hypothetical protein AAF993_17485 [Pseudomonadota bacterium]
MDVFTMVAIIVVVSVGAGVVNNYLKTQRGKHNLQHQQDINQELEVLRKRVEVLEKIVTDDKYQLNKELDKL